MVRNIITINNGISAIKTSIQLFCQTIFYKTHNSQRNKWMYIIKTAINDEKCEHRRCFI